MRKPLQCHCLIHYYSDQGESICTECHHNISEDVFFLKTQGHNYPPTHRKTEKGIEKIPLRSNGQIKGF